MPHFRSAAVLLLFLFCAALSQLSDSTLKKNTVFYRSPDLAGYQRILWGRVSAGLTMTFDMEVAYDDSTGLRFEQFNTFCLYVGYPLGSNYLHVEPRLEISSNSRTDMDNPLRGLALTLLFYPEALLFDRIRLQAGTSLVSLYPVGLRVSVRPYLLAGVVF